MDSAKMSKSLGNVVRPRPIVHVLGMDALRYYLCARPFSGRTEISVMTRSFSATTANLANGLGNLASRTAAMIEKNSGAGSQACHAATAGHRLGHAAQAAIGGSYGAVRQSGILSRTGAALVADRRDGQIPTTEHPWSLGESDAEQQRRSTILWTTAEVLRIVTALTHPVLPESTTRVWSLLGQPGQPGLLRWTT